MSDKMASNEFTIIVANLNEILENIILFKKKQFFQNSKVGGELILKLNNKKTSINKIIEELKIHENNMENSLEIESALTIKKINKMHEIVDKLKNDEIEKFNEYEDMILKIIDKDLKQINPDIVILRKKIKREMSFINKMKRFFYNKKNK